MRGPQDEETEWSVDNTYSLLNTLPFINYQLITGVQSPRILIDDNPISTIPTVTNSNDWLNKL